MSGRLWDTLHCWRRLYWACGSKKYSSFSFQATEMVLTSKWGRIQPEIQVVAASWTLIGSPKHAEKIPIQLISAMGPSSPAVHWFWWGAEPWIFALQLGQGELDSALTKTLLCYKQIILKFLKFLKFYFYFPILSDYECNINNFISLAFGKYIIDIKYFVWVFTPHPSVM